MKIRTDLIKKFLSRGLCSPNAFLSTWGKSHFPKVEIDDLSSHHW